MAELILFANAAVESEDNRVIGGLAVPFDKDSSPAEFGGETYIHQFKRGAFTRSIKERLGKIRLYAEHNRQNLPVGKAMELTETDEGLQARFQVADTAAGNDALQLVRDEFVNGFSVGVSPIQFREEEGRLIHLESRIDEVSLTAMPSFETATASAFSETTRCIHPDIARRRLRLLESEILS